MDIAVIGTSNSVLKDGWVAALRLQRPLDRIHNLSIGLNCSAYGVYAAAAYRELLKKCSVVVVDFCVNDTNFIKRGFSAARIESYVSAIYADVAGTSCPVALVLPTRSTINETDSPAYEIHRKIAALHGIPLIDAVTLSRALAGLADVKPEELFQNDVHLSPAIARIMGTVVSRWIDHLEPVAQDLAGAIAAHMQKGSSYEAIFAGDIAETTVHRENSLTAVELAEIRTGQLIKWQSQTHIEIHGIYVNYAQTDNAAIKLQGEAASGAVHIHPDEISKEKTLLMRLEVLDEPLTVKAGETVGLSIEPLQSDKAENEPEGESSLRGEIGGLLARSRQEQQAPAALSPRLSHDQVPRPSEREVKAILGAGVGLIKERMDSAEQFAQVLRKPLNRLAKALRSDAADLGELRTLAANLAEKCRMYDVEEKLVRYSLLGAPEAPWLLLRQGKNLLNQGRREEAMEIFQKAKKYADGQTKVRIEAWMEKATAAD